MTRYHPLLVALHWLTAAMILGALFMGTTALAPMDNADPAKLDGLRAHMTVGLAVGALFLVRLVTRLTTSKPPHADAGHAGLNLAGRAAHWGLYLLVFLMVASGMGISLSAGLPEIVFQGSGAPLPADFSAYPPRAAHGVIAKLLMALIAAHVAGWAFHQFIRKDGLIRRMWFGQRGA